jgi:hypothetical protein
VSETCGEAVLWNHLDAFIVYILAFFLDIWILYILGKCSEY